VSFFSYQPDTAFQPEDVQLLHQGQLLRPLAIFPITSGWGSQRLQQQDNQSALYAFESPIDYDQPHRPLVEGGRLADRVACCARNGQVLSAWAAAPAGRPRSSLVEMVGVSSGSPPCAPRRLHRVIQAGQAIRIAA
jgi:hypothetical protein